MRVAALSLLLAAVPTWALVVGPSRPVAPCFTPRALDAPSMMAKSKKPSRKKPSSGAKKSAAPASMPAQESLMDFAGAPKETLQAPAAPAAREGSRDVRIDAALRNAGLSPSDGESLLPPSAPTSLDPLGRIPKKGQELLERFFSTGAVVTGGVFISAGLGVSVEVRQDWSLHPP